MIKKFMSNYAKQKRTERKDELYRKLVRYEAQIGASVFGKVPNGHRREFFCLDEHSWVWHEEWIDHSGNNQSMTTRYDVRPDGIVKVQNGQYRSVSKAEAKRLQMAVHAYEQKVMSELYAGIV